MINYHEPAIRGFAQQWPHFDFKDYLSATTPGYHVVLATVARWVNPATAALQFAGLLFAVRLIISLTTFGTSRVGNREGFARRHHSPHLSMHSSAAAHLLPDNAGWLGVLLVLIVAAPPQRQTWVWLAMGGVALAARWCLRDRFTCGRPHRRGRRRSSVRRMCILPAEQRRIASNHDALRQGSIAIVMTLPAFLVVGYFFKLWGGLTPPMFKDFHASGVDLRPLRSCSHWWAELSLFFVARWWPSLAAIRN